MKALPIEEVQKPPQLVPARSCYGSTTTVKGTFRQPGTSEVPFPGRLGAIAT